MKQRKKNGVTYRLVRHLKRSKCFLFNRRGDGVHSPYAFRLIRQVLRNPHPYVAFTHLATLLSEHRDGLRQSYEHRALCNKRYLETIFRLGVDARVDQALVVGWKDGLVAQYLSTALSSRRVLVFTPNEPISASRLSASRLIVLEATAIEQLDTLAEALCKRERSTEPSLLILNSYNPEIRRAKALLRRQLCPDIQFDLKGLDIWVWRLGLTPGNYSVYN